MMKVDAKRDGDHLISEPATKCSRKSHSSADAGAELEEFSDDEKSGFQLWADSLFFSTDLNGSQQLLDVDGVQVMMEWEKEYMERCIDRLGIDSTCDVLEIGFGCGYSASRIQAYKPRSHVIIEVSATVLKKLHSWAADKPNVRVVAGTWQERLPELGRFDRLFFDDYGEPGMQPAVDIANIEYRKEYSKGERHFDGLLGLLTRWHSQPGARLSGYCLAPVEIRQPDLSVSYRKMKVTVPSNCRYFSGDVAVIPLYTYHPDGASACTTRLDDDGYDVGTSDSESVSRKPCI